MLSFCLKWRLFQCKLLNLILSSIISFPIKNRFVVWTNVPFYLSKFWVNFMNVFSIKENASIRQCSHVSVELRFFSSFIFIEVSNYSETSHKSNKIYKLCKTVPHTFYRSIEASKLFLIFFICKTKPIRPIKFKRASDNLRGICIFFFHFD